MLTRRRARFRETTLGTSTSTCRRCCRKEGHTCHVRSYSSIPYSTDGPIDKSAGRCAKKLGIQYADAVTGFEFKSRAAHPILTGVVVASGDAELLLEVRLPSSSLPASD